MSTLGTNVSSIWSPFYNATLRETYCRTPNPMNSVKIYMVNIQTYMVTWSFQYLFVFIEPENSFIKIQTSILMQSVSE